MGDTNISVSDEVWMELNSRKRPGDTFDDVLRRVLELDGVDEDKPTTAMQSESESVTREGEPAPQTPLPEGLPAGLDDDEVRAAVDAVVAYLRDEGGGTRSEIARELMADHDLGYEVPDSFSDFRRAWWRKVIKPALEQHEHVEKPPQGGSRWRWVGDE